MKKSENKNYKISKRPETKSSNKKEKAFGIRMYNFFICLEIQNYYAINSRW